MDRFLVSTRYGKGVLYPCCAGLDLHKESVVACILTPGQGSEPTKRIRQFVTTTAELEPLRDWLGGSAARVV